MKTPIIYLQKDYFGALSFVSVDKNKLSTIDVFRNESLNITKHEDLDECDNYIQILLSDGFVPSDRESFNEAFIGFANNINELSKEL